MSDGWAELLQVGVVFAVAQELDGVLGLQAQECLSLGNAFSSLRKHPLLAKEVETIKSMYSLRFIYIPGQPS